MAESPLRERWDEALTFPEYLLTVEKNAALWKGVWDRVRLPEDLVEEARSPGRAFHLLHLLALSEDWCGDAVNTLPVVGRFAEAVDGVEMRVISRDENPALIDAHLTNGSRSIPVVFVLDADFEEIGWWGPRPREIQAWVMANRAMPSEDRYREVRRRYARDHGRSAIAEILEIMRGAPV